MAQKACPGLKDSEKMKKISFAKDKEKQEKRMKMWLTIFIVAVMALSTAGFALNFASTERKSYNGIKFTRTEEGWQPKGYSIATVYIPQDVENISSEGTFSANDFNAKAYLISPPYMRNSALELLRALPLKSIQQACLPEQENEPYCSDLPLKSCEDADSQNAIIIFNEKNETAIRYRGYCLQIEGDAESSLRAADKAVFIAYGMIKQE